VPKVTQQHRDARRDQILAAAKRCFVREGFQATSMQDLFAESGLSAGSFYRYFATKDDIILAIAEQNLTMVTTLIREVAAGGPERGLGETLAAVLETVQARNRDDQLAATAILTWAEALRSPTLHARFHELMGRMRTDLTEVVAAQQAAGRLPTDADAGALAKLFLAVVPGALVQLALFGERDLDGVTAAARAMWPIAAPAPKRSDRQSPS
jgi:AcrR family transcriptional regulator